MLNAVGVRYMSCSCDERGPTDDGVSGSCWGPYAFLLRLPSDRSCSKEPRGCGVAPLLVPTADLVLRLYSTAVPAGVQWPVPAWVRR